MAECNTCGGYLSIEDKIRLSMKCDANGNVVWQGALLNEILILNLFAFWSKETDSDYYVSLEDDSPYYSLTEKK